MKYSHRAATYSRGVQPPCSGAIQPQRTTPIRSVSVPM